MNQGVYLGPLCEYYFDYFELILTTVFQQDGALAYTAKFITQWFDCNGTLHKRLVIQNR